MFQTFPFFFLACALAFRCGRSDVFPFARAGSNATEWNSRVREIAADRPQIANLISTCEAGIVTFKEGKLS